MRIPWLAKHTCGAEKNKDGQLLPGWLEKEEKDGLSDHREDAGQL
jgi:hypothetical protein